VLDIVEHLDEGVGRLEEADRRGAVVHGDGVGRGEVADDLRRDGGADRRPAADGDEQEVDLADRGPLLGPKARLAEVAEVGDPYAVQVKAKIVLGPRAVPAASSCSEAIATTSPTGVSNRPAVERTRCGSPEIASTALWSRCSCVTSRRWAGCGSIGG
jgi:hypothetical protein